MKLSLPYRAQGWKTAPISPTCGYLFGSGLATMRYCSRPTAICYPAMGGGWMALCESHGAKHLPQAFRIEDLIRSGEKFDGAPCHETEGLIFCECGKCLTEDEACAGYMVNERPACETCWQDASDSQY